MFKDGWYLASQQIKSNNYNQRPSDCSVDLVVIHCISLPEGQYDNQNVENFFQNKLNCSLDKSFESLQDVKVSAHFYIKRCGSILQFVSVNNRAWHAGSSEYKGKKGCNDFSVGIEMQGTDKDTYTARQYKSLNKLLADLRTSYRSIVNITGHENIAPKRKTDPGLYFEWDKVSF